LKTDLFSHLICIELKIKSVKSHLTGEIRIPASKSHTIRALAIAGMAEGKSVLENPLIASDTISCINGIKKFGAAVKMNSDIEITGIKGVLSPHCKKIDTGNSGTTLRILSALAALASHPVTFDGDASIRKRPMIPLLSALENLGVEIISTNGKCPLTVRGPIKGGKTTVNGISSQFVTALLIACPLAEGDSEIIVENLHEKPYLEITLDWLERQGIKYENKGLDWFKIKGGQQYKSYTRAIPADFSSAAFSLCAAAIAGSDVLIKGLDFSDHQGDKNVFGYIEKMGALIKHTSEGVLVSNNKLSGMEIDMNATPDALPALAVVACFAEGKTRLYNVAQARLKECDRISAVATELKKMNW
jgi:3-phosphoshikimate 1-carboxyvinyltransferase